MLSLRPPSLNDQIAGFLRDEHIEGAVIAYGRIGSRPTVLAIGKATPDHRWGALTPFPPSPVPQSR